ncbi:chemotaxis response regulator protein-glutamate methylesterase [Clostridium tagluense]|uniref:protein-glutamate methylesterase/protein-glutamine glutaminase n=1 Tax=Clostridium tagluense TaxID=360422 RepID=UPI001CF1181F|nr:chemotaxis response regulator protein-glutamate methylesterase [Clostridium tagluense]MCB2312614.1 chemotaxis response regulator protein-glutamate methylesterase [Clostridium tagluense]MCB2317290.1 chemotaxis response regulator protein-glutamate methylesterase [Clostridium tagluense]MCB2322157.1 chemotaxis response regulator protein-glutamate methylesterase [Clostridium tagluense]MCB2327086.1 chemotaxis response regulator protein-glutamate methylesterase [Clostridium tagluense]MCB2331804.1 
MNIAKKIRVLVVDDSILFREAIARGIALDRGIEVIGTAGDAFEARDKIIEFEPDVMTLDVEMPKMNGIEFLKRLIPQYPMPVVVVSAVSDNVFDALNAGAVDFVTKMNSVTGTNKGIFINELIIKIKIASMAKVGHLKKDNTSERRIGKINSRNNNTIIAIGASTGGTQAILEVVKDFPPDMPGIIITQHMPAVFTKMYADRLNKLCPMEVKEAETGDIVHQGRILIAPGDKHMELNRRGNNYYVECFTGDKVNGHCPSVDVLFNSVADIAGSTAIGIILTGMGYDGAKGLMKMKQKGAYTIGQDEQSSVVYGMPKVAYDIGGVTKQASLKNIPKLVYSILEDKK